jgi:uncharacterized protein (TIGR02145 family)
MKTYFSKLAFTATLAVAITLTLSCSGGDDGGNEPSSGSGTAISSSSDGGGGSGLTGTSGTFTDSRDGKVYKSVKIGTQTWMAQNLDYNASGSKCQENSDANCTKYGRLYDWATAKTACPTGWHIPSDAEWGALMQFVNPKCSPTYDDCADAGKLLKATSGWNDYRGQSGNGTDDYGFSALPGGCISGVHFDDVGNFGHWWSATEYNADKAYSWLVSYSYEDLRRNRLDKSSLRSVRCLQDN